MPTDSPPPPADPDRVTPPECQPANSRRRRRWLLGIPLVPVALYVLYLLAVHLLLLSGIGERLITRQPERFQISWGSGTSWIPGNGRDEGGPPHDPARGRRRKQPLR